MRSLWVAAVEQGEHVFNEHRQALESDLETQKRALDDVVVERDAAQAPSRASAISLPWSWLARGDKSAA